MIKLIIFDLDGTLIDAYTAIHQSINYTMVRLGYPRRGYAAVKKAVGWGDRELLKGYVKNTDLKNALKIYREHHRLALLKYAKLLPDVKIVLSRLKRTKYKLAVASNRPQKFSRILLRHLSIGRYFDFVLCGDQLVHGKPHPEILYRIMKKFNIPPSQTLYLGDMTVDVIAGNSAGVRTIAVLGGSSSLKELKLKKPYRIIKNISFLKEILNQINVSRG
ncbi:MAG: HAD family hydrolase [Candidatus Omnitrophota bacterium]